MVWRLVFRCNIEYTIINDISKTYIFNIVWIQSN